MRKLLVFIIIVLLIPVAFAQKDLPSYEKMSLSIDGRTDWTNTLIKLRVGEFIKINARGAIRTSTSGDLTSPAGIDEAATGGYTCPGVNQDSLVAKLGENGKCFLIGDYVEFVPKEDQFFYFAINDDQLKDNSGKFEVVLEITRPECGDNVCEDGEIGFCKEDCKWCGDGVCSEKEACTLCSEDCGFCEEDVTDLERISKNFLNSRQENDYDSLILMTVDPVNEIFTKFKEFHEKFKDKASFSDQEKINELLHDLNYGEISIVVDDISEDEAIVTASTAEGELELTLQLDGNWKVKDVKENGTLLSTVDLSALESEQEEIIEDLTEEIFEEKTGELKEEESDFKFPWKAIFRIFLVIVIITVLIFGGIFISKKLKNVRFTTKETIVEEVPIETTEYSGSVTKCHNCNATVLEGDAFCTSCGARIKKKR